MIGKILAIGIISICSQTATAGSTARSKEHLKMLNQGFMNIADDEFWKLDPRSGLSPYLNTFFDKFHGLALDAPRNAIDIRARSTLPVAALSIITYKQASGWRFDKDTVIIASEINRLHCYAATLFAPPKRRVPPPEPRDTTEDDSEGEIGESALVEARSRLKLPWEPSKYKFIMLSRSWVSNPVYVELFDSQNPIAPQVPLKPLTGSGIVLTSTGNEKNTMLEAKFKIRARREYLAAFQQSDSNKTVVPITFVIIRHQDVVVPNVKEFAAPAKWINELGSPEYVQGDIRIPLIEIAPHLRADTYYIYAFAGEEMAGPVQVVTKENN